MSASNPAQSLLVFGLDGELLGPLVVPSAAVEVPSPSETRAEVKNTTTSPNVNRTAKMIKYSSANGDTYFHDGYLYHLKKRRNDGSCLLYCADRRKYDCPGVVERQHYGVVLIRTDHVNHSPDTADCALRIAARVHRSETKRRLDARFAAILEQLRAYHEEFDPIFAAEDSEKLIESK